MDVYKDKWRGLVNTVLNLRIALNKGNMLTS